MRKMLTSLMGPVCVTALHVRGSDPIVSTPGMTAIIMPGGKLMLKEAESLLKSFTRVHV